MSKTRNLADNIFDYTSTAIDKTLVNNEICLVTAASKTITLPVSPNEGDTVGIVVKNFKDTVIARNGSTIMELTEDMIIDKEYSSVKLKYIDNSWRLY